MKHEWKICQWGDLVILEYGKGLRGYEDNNGLYPVFGTNGQIGWHSEPLCHQPGVIIGRKGAYRGVHYSRKPFYVIDTAFYLRPKENIAIDLRWAYYQLLTQDINGLDTGSAIPSLSRESFYGLTVKVPPLTEQYDIAYILGTLDDKIDLNRRMSETLEAMAQALFKSWFVDFDPVRARAAGRQPYGMDADTSALFPDEFEDSELGEIPKRWKVKTLGELCDIGGGFVQTGPFGSQLHASDYVEDGIPVVMPVNLGENRISEENIARISVEMRDKLSRHMLAKGDIVYARRGDIGRKAYVRERESGWLCGTGCLLIHLDKAPIDSLYLSLYLSQENIKDSLVANAVGSTMPNLNTGILRSIPVLVPPAAIQNKAVENLGQWDELIATNDAANKTLASLRDLLLPRLLSGELRVKEAEQELAEVM